ncbi:MAG: 4-hydroxyphenylpyruvate dioxygenase [Vulcanimicrobiaceae bacterium]
METLTRQPRAGLERVDWDHLRFYVGNARQAAHYYATAFGFRVAAYAGPETGEPDAASYLLVQNDLRFALTTSLRPDDPIARHVAKHGDGIRDIALRVPDARKAFAAALAAGAAALAGPTETHDEHGSVVQASIATYGETIHTFVERTAYRGPFLPGYVAVATSPSAPHAPGLHAIDHCVGNVGWNQMETWGEFYAGCFGFSRLVSFDDTDISTEFTALRSIVMSDADRRVKFPINEPAQGRKHSQIEEFLDFYGGAGVQHVAIATDDIVTAIRALRANGVEFLTTPASYYDALEARVGPIAEAIDVLRELNILVDRDDLGYMLQIFTKPLQDRPTVFFEIIQRKGSLSFGKGNFKALFVAIEEEQAKRGTL